ncbi:MAG: FxLYD domain-containing protein [Cyanophyceae cyanobacterium]
MLRAFAIFSVSLLMWLTSWVYTPTAEAITQIKLYDLSYQDCPAEFAEGNVTSGGGSRPATCYLVSGKAKNTSGKPVYDADVYGRIYDANDNPVLQNRTRVGSIAEVPPGVSDFELRITVPANQPTPLKLEQFKASGFVGRVKPSF